MKHNEMKQSFTLQIWTGALGLVARREGTAWKLQGPGP